MKRYLGLLAAVLFCLSGLMPVEALGITGLTVTLSCTGFSYSDFTYSFDRDNTGTGQEAYQIVVTDSASNVVHLVSNTVAISGPYSESAASGTYNIGTAVPGAVTYKWISQAGNSLPEQVAFSYTGYCGEPPTATPTLTPTPTNTPGPSPTPTPTITPTASVIDVYSVGGQDVVVVREVKPAEVVTIGLLTIVAGLQMSFLILFVRSQNK